jgi:phage-related protein
MAAGDFTAGLSGLANAMVGMKKSSKEAQVAALKYKVLNTTLGPLTDIFMKAKQYLILLAEAFTDTDKTVDETTESVEALSDALSPLTKTLQAMKMTILFLVGIFALVSTALVIFTGSIGGATAAFPEFFAAFESIKDSILEVIGHLRTIGATILALDWSPLLNVATVAIMGLISLIMQFYVFAFNVIAMVIGEFAKLFTYMAETGAFQAIIDGYAGILTAVLLVFGYIGEILNAFGINFDSVFAAVSAIFGGFVDFLINSGLLLFFADLIGWIGAVLPPFVIVVGEILVLTAKVLAFFLGPIAVGIVSVVKIIINVIAGAIAIVVAAFRIAFAVMKTIADVWMAIFTGNWRDIPGIIGGLFSKVLDIVGDLFDSLVAVFINIGEAIIAPFVYVYEQVADIFASMYNAIKDPIMDAIDWVMTPINELIDTIDSISLGGIADSAGDFLGSLNPFSSGGISRGPTSGYPVALHGTEAVVPLPDGRTIPVTVKGMGGGGGDNITVNIAVKGGGNAKEIAKAVSQEVQRTFRNRSRGMGFTRGV